MLFRLSQRRLGWGAGLLAACCTAVVAAGDGFGDRWREEHPEWIWADDFENRTAMGDKYFEHGDDQGDFIVVNGVGVNGGRGLRVRFQPGEVSAGSFKKSFGRSPGGYIGRHAERSNEDFEEIYWRIDLRREPNWKGGGGAKLTRAMTLANSGWAQGLIAHLWSSGAGGAYLTMDPASGIDPDGNLVSTKYNDFGNLRWLGSRRGEIPLFNDENAGRWFCIEAHVKINTPGKSDGIFEYWINGELQASRKDLNWHGDWNADPENYMINAVFVSNYWNDGSPQEQERYLDNFVISTARIGCDGSDANMERADADGDGVPDDYEVRHAAFQVGSDDRFQDSDADGMANAEEYVAGTDPQDPDSNLRWLQPILLDNQVELSFRTVANRRYVVESLAGSGFGGGWSEAGLPEVLGTGSRKAILLPLAGEGVRVFRVRVTGGG